MAEPDVRYLNRELSMLDFQARVLAYGADLAHLVWAVNLGCLGFHSWPVRATHGDSTTAQERRNADWGYEHDMLQYIPVGL